MHLLSFAPPQVRSDCPRLVMTGRDEVLIEQHTGLFSYETKCIRVRTRDGLWTVTGEKLVIAYFGVRDLLIQGKIDGVSVSGEGI
ncbi:MAG: YabP/YqfC family sporulation protein [Clostridia bacterium]|nr:YabP/YqfC family sporulation protein [Clostridia bacterium]